MDDTYLDALLQGMNRFFDLWVTLEESILEPSKQVAILTEILTLCAFIGFDGWKVKQFQGQLEQLQVQTFNNLLGQTEINL